MYVLRKSFGAYSAGTPIYPTGDIYPDDVAGKEVQFHDVFFGDEIVSIPNDYITKRRNRTVMRPNNDSSRERRKTKRLARAGL